MYTNHVTKAIGMVETPSKFNNTMINGTYIKISSIECI